MSNGIIYYTNPDRCEYDITFHFLAYKEGKTEITLEAPDLFSNNKAFADALISALLKTMEKHGLGEGDKGLRRLPDEEEEVGA